MALATDLVEREYRGKVNGFINFMSYIAMGFGMLLGNYLYIAFAPQLPFYTALALTVPAFVITIFLVKEARATRIHRLRGTCPVDPVSIMFLETGIPIASNLKVNYQRRATCQIVSHPVHTYVTVGKSRRSDHFEVGGDVLGYRRLVFGCNDHFVCRVLVHAIRKVLSHSVDNCTQLCSNGNRFCPTSIWSRVLQVESEYAFRFLHDTLRF
jgi:hypothetical protein